jgi:hypothetical protein
VPAPISPIEKSVTARHNANTAHIPAIGSQFSSKNRHAANDSLPAIAPLCVDFFCRSATLLQGA